MLDKNVKRYFLQKIFLTPWNFEQSRHGFSSSGRKETRAEIPRKVWQWLWHGQWRLELWVTGAVETPTSSWRLWRVWVDIGAWTPQSGSVPVGDEEGWEEVTSFLGSGMTHSSFFDTMILVTVTFHQKVWNHDKFTNHSLCWLFSYHCFHINLIVKFNCEWQHYTGMCRWWVWAGDLTRQPERSCSTKLFKHHIEKGGPPLTATGSLSMTQALYWKTNGCCLPHCSFVIHFHIGSIFAISICLLDNKYKQTNPHIFLTSRQITRPDSPQRQPCIQTSLLYYLRTLQNTPTCMFFTIYMRKLTAKHKHIWSFMSATGWFENFSQSNFWALIIILCLQTNQIQMNINTRNKFIKIIKIHDRHITGSQCNLVQSVEFIQCQVGDSFTLAPQLDKNHKIVW